MTQPDLDWLPFSDISGDAFENARKVKRSIRPFLSELQTCMRAMDDPDDISTASGASYVGLPGGSNFATVDFLGNALIAQGDFAPGKHRLKLTYFPGWFLQVLIRARLIPHWSIPPKQACEQISFEQVGNNIDIAVRHLERARPLQIELDQLKLYRGDAHERPFHYHFQPSRWNALTNREDGEPDVTVLEPDKLLRVEWSQPRLTLSLLPGVKSHVTEIAETARTICFREYHGHNEIMLNFAQIQEPGIFSTQTVNFDYRRQQDGNLPKGWMRNAPTAGQYTIADCLPPLAASAAMLREFSQQQDSQEIDGDVEDTDEPDDEELDPFETLDPDLGDRVETLPTFEDMAMSWPEGDLPYRRFDRPGGACFAFFTRKAIMDRLRDQRKALEIFLSEDDVMFTMLPRMANWLASPHAWDPLFDPNALLLDVLIEDPSDANQRFRVDAIPLDGDHNAQTPPYDLSKLPLRPPWYRVNIQHTKGVKFGIRSHKEFVTELSDAGANYIEINSRNRELHFDDFAEPDPGRMIDLFEGNGYVGGETVLETQFNHDDLVRALQNSIPIATDQFMLIAGFTPAGVLADIYDGANLIVFAVSYGLTGQGRDLFLRKATPSDAASMAIGLLPFLPTGKATESVLNLISLSWGIKDIGMMGYEISKNGLRTHQLMYQDAQELFDTIHGKIGTGPGTNKR